VSSVELSLGDSESPVELQVILAAVRGHCAVDLPMPGVFELESIRAGEQSSLGANAEATLRGDTSSHKAHLTTDGIWLMTSSRSFRKHGKKASERSTMARFAISYAA
jgi:hypothetical protein